MASVLSAVTPDGASEVAAFLAGVFGSDPSGGVPGLAEWKYFAKHPWWEGSRSFFLSTDRGNAAHACVAPVRFQVGGETRDSMQIIDWAGSKAFPGAGLLIYRKVLAEYKSTSLLAIGGSDDTLRILPQVPWFRRLDDIVGFARPLRAWKYYGHPTAGLRGLAKVARNWMWQEIPGLPASDGWAVMPVPSLERVFQPRGPHPVILRTPDWMACLQACPAAQMRCLELHYKGSFAGHALLAQRRGAVRLVDLAVDGDLTAALAAVIRFAAKIPDAVEIAGGSSLPEYAQAFEACGMKLRWRDPVYIADPHKTLPAGSPVEANPSIGDAFYLQGADCPFRC